MVQSTNKLAQQFVINVFLIEWLKGFKKLLSEQDETHYYLL